MGISRMTSIQDRRRRPGFFSGRVLAIAIVVAVSAVSFTLGYYVGSSGSGDAPRQATQVVPEGAGLVLLGSGNACDQKENEAGTQGDDEEGNGNTLEIRNVASQIKSTEPSAGMTLVPEPDMAMDQGPDEPVLEPIKSSKPPVAKDPPPASRPHVVQKPAPPKRPAPRKQAEQSPATAPVNSGAFSVQIGAFKSLSDAQILKLRFAKKGYKASVYKDDSAGGSASFKVRIGVYARRDKAALMADKLQSQEGISAFVTAID